MIIDYDQAGQLPVLPGLIASAAVAKRLQPGCGFAVDQAAGPVDWTRTSVENQRDDECTIVYRSATGLEAVCTVRLLSGHRVAVYQTTLTNTSASAVTCTGAAPLSLRLTDVAGPRIKCCSGAANACGWPHAREYPPDAFRPREIVPHFPRPVMFSSDGVGERRTGSSAKYLPLFMFCPEAAWDSPGFFFGLEWSGMWEAAVTFGDAPDVIDIRVGPQVSNLVLASSASIALPAAHIGFFENGFESGTNACRRYIYDCLTPHYQGKPTLPAVAYSVWPGFEDDFTQDDLFPHVDAAAEMGVEMFMVDAGWYAGGYPHGVGDWEVDLGKFPDGYEAFSAYARARGVGVGLYVDGTAWPGTKLPTAHPEFYYDLPERYRPLKYNFSRRDACDHMIEMISSWCERFDLRYLRADFYCDPLGGKKALVHGCTRWDLIDDTILFDWDMIDPHGTIRFAHFEGLYYVLESVTRRNPHLMLELNNGGGNNIDLGTLGRHHCSWLSDNTWNPFTCSFAQFGANTFVPGNYLAMALSVSGNDDTRATECDYSDIAFLGRMAGEFMLAGHIAKWPADVRSRGRHWIGVFKRIRHLLVKDFYRLLPPPQSEADWDAAQFCDGPETGIVFVFRRTGETAVQRLRLRAIDSDRDYRVTDEATGDGDLVTGHELATEGLRVELAVSSAKLFSYCPA